MTVEKQVKIFRGYYLTGVGQEESAYYFKIDDQHPDYETIQAGDVAVTFYQNKDVITSIPALIRIDSTIEGQKRVSAFLKGEQVDHIPMLPIAFVYEGFDPLRFKQIMGTFEGLQSEIEQLANVTYIQGDLFEFLNEKTVNPAR
ncbi:TPA: hypothetical protein ACT2IF_000251 [Streptococcus suis]